MDDTNVGPGMVNHRKHCQCLECAYQNVLAERDGLLSARDDLAESNRRLVAELGDAKQSVIDLNGANAAYVRANGRLHAEVRAGKLLREGLSTLANKASDYFEALERLTHGVGGMIGIADAAIREAIGNTNFAVLEERLAEANAALAGAAVPASEPPEYRDFWRKYAMPPLARPSCIVCGRLPETWPPAIQHVELPGIVVCFPCRDAAQRPAVQQVRSLVCQDCGADRYKEPCRRPSQINCPMVGVAHTTPAPHTEGKP